MIYELNKYNEIKFDKNYFVIGNTKYYTGTIISVRGQMLINKHYGVFLGIANNEILIIHNFVYISKEFKNKYNSHVTICDLTTFAYGSPNKKVNIEFKVDNYNKELHDKIIERAIDASKKKFNLIKNNCEHFANYVVFGTYKSEQIKYYEFSSQLFEFLSKSSHLLVNNPEYLEKKINSIKKKIIRNF